MQAVVAVQYSHTGVSTVLYCITLISEMKRRTVITVVAPVLLSVKNVVFSIHLLPIVA